MRSIHLPPTSFPCEQLDAVNDDSTIDAVKIGILATSGDQLLDERAEAVLRELLADIDIVTPNLPELAMLIQRLGRARTHLLRPGDLSRSDLRSAW